MTASKLLVYYRAPESGTLLSGNPDVESMDIPDDDLRPGDIFELNGRRIQIVGRKVSHDGEKRTVSYVAREERLWERMLGGAA